MSKQDRQGVRTAADVERKYLLTLGKTFAEIMGIALDARKTAVEVDAKLTEEVNRLEKFIGETEKGILLSVSETYATNESVSSKIDLMKDNILLEVEGKYGNGNSLAAIELRVSKNEASIGLVVENGGVKGGVLIEAINGETTAKISADRLDIEGKMLNIKVDATNIAGRLTADQIAANAITSNKIAAGAITTSKIETGAITADKISADSLEAISARIGGLVIENGVIRSTAGNYGTYSYTTTGTSYYTATGYAFTVLRAYGIFFVVKESSEYTSDTIVTINPISGKATSGDIGEVLPV